MVAFQNGTTVHLNGHSKDAKKKYTDVAKLDFETFISCVESKLLLAHGYVQREPSTTTEGLSFSIEVSHTPDATIAPWSTAQESILKIHSGDFVSKGQALTHFKEVATDIFNDLSFVVDFDELSWESTGAASTDTSESIVWVNAPHPMWNGFVHRTIGVKGQDQWFCTTTVQLRKAFAVLAGLSDLRLAAAPRTHSISSRSYVFGLSIPSLNFDSNESVLSVTRAVRETDISLYGYPGICERLSFFRNADNLGDSCAITISKVVGSDAAYSISDAWADAERLIHSLPVDNAGSVRITKPAVQLSSVADLTKDLILQLAGGKGVLAIIMKNVVDRKTVCTTLRELKTEPGFWVEYDHELIDKVTGKKRYEFYGVYRPKISHPFNRTYLEPPESPEWKAYFDSARALGDYLRAKLRPYEYPIDRFLSHLDTLMDTNVHVHPRFGQKMQAGMLRLMPNNAVTGIHIDRPPDTDLGVFRNILSTNFYTAPSSTEKGGELLVWDAPGIRFGSDLKTVTQDHVSLHLSPEEGDAIMICPELPHAIARVTQGERISLNVFLGLLADEDKLRVWN